MDNHLFYHKITEKNFFRTILYHHGAGASTPRAKFCLFFTFAREKQHIERFCSMGAEYEQTFSLLWKILGFTKDVETLEFT